MEARQGDGCELEDISLVCYGDAFDKDLVLMAYGKFK